MADLVTLTVTGGLPLIPGISAPITLGEVRLLTLLLASELTASNLSNQLIDVGLFVKAGKPLRAPTGNKYYDAFKETVEAFILQLDYLALNNPYLYQNARQNFREIVSRIIPGTGLTAPGSTAVTVASGEGAVTAEQGMAIVNGNTAEVENRASASQQLLSGMAAGNGGGNASIDAGLIPDIKVTKVEGMRYGFADFESAGVVKETQYLPENMWKMSDAEQFKWLDEQIGGTVDGYTWHHTEIPGKMQLVPTGIHNITTHNGGRTAGMWADAPR